MIDLFKVKTPDIKDLEKYKSDGSLPKVSDLEGEVRKPFYKKPIYLIIIIVSISMSVISMIISLFIR